jgi:hypothetical protein
LRERFRLLLLGETRAYGLGTEAGLGRLDDARAQRRRQLAAALLRGAARWRLLFSWCFGGALALALALFLAPARYLVLLLALFLVVFLVL